MGLGQKPGLLILAFSCFVSFTPSALAQGTYSADSLMAAFEKNVKTAPKGSEIIFTDIVLEYKKSRVIFRSSANDKVICELLSPPGNANLDVTVGRPLTVTGKVRGRGILRNVTLDECRLATNNARQDSLDLTSQHPVSIEVLPEPVPIPLEDAASKEPIEVKTPQLLTAKSDPLPLTHSVPNRAIQADTAAQPVPMANERPCSPGVEQPNKTIATDSDSINPYFVVGSYALLAALGGFALLALVKICHICLTNRSGSSRSGSITEEMRRDALEALLLEKKKKKWFA